MLNTPLWLIILDNKKKRRMGCIRTCCLCECLEWLLCPPQIEKERGNVSNITSKTTSKKVYGSGIQPGITGKTGYEALGAYLPSYKIYTQREQDTWRY